MASYNSIPHSRKAQPSRHFLYFLGGGIAEGDERKEQDIKVISTRPRRTRLSPVAAVPPADQGNQYYKN